ncbi:MAG: ammonia-forming cytochrome c nitrite reductase subunit c552 [Propionibacteriaceae bacterium]|nr:ammonia-forming cytochrome c nitrite reductase subunit c552 [Propionibacteriaceae bacterium]
MTDKTRRGVPFWVLLVAVVVVAGLTFFLTALIANIGERKGESATQYTEVVKLTQTTYDPAEWGRNFPAQYDGWKATEVYKSSDHKPDALVPNVDLATAGTPINRDFDTREVVPSSKIEDDSRVKRLWQGFAFAIDYRHARGHAYMLEDQITTKRSNERNQPGACIHCHASNVALWAEHSTAGPNASFNETMDSGFKALNAIPYNCQATSVTPEWKATQPADRNCDDVTKDMVSYVKMASVDKTNGDPIGCIDCHDPETMKLRISRPGLINSMEMMKAEEGNANYDVNKDATTQEMRALVCAQCHIEYYFGGPNKDVIFPWKYGTEIDLTWKYYQEDFTSIDNTGTAGVAGVPFSDYFNPRAQVAMLKVQHPEYEVWSTSIHAANGVTCADCHMSYQRQGSQKVSNHDVQNPLTNISGSCGACHTASEQILQDRVRTINNRFKVSRDAGLDSMMVLIDMLEAVQAEGSTVKVPDETMAQVKELARFAGYYIDYAYSENSYGFHSPDYMQRVIGQSIDASRQGQLLLAALGAEVPDLSPSERTLEHREHVLETGLR